jgi:post-segregation antitoxin (ccd killing protein)
MTVETPIRRKPTNLSLEVELGRRGAAAWHQPVARRRGWAAPRRRRGSEAALAEENAEGIRQMNAYVADYGLPLAKYRLF